MSQLSSFKDDVIGGVTNLAATMFAGFVQQAKNDTTAFLTNAANDVADWRTQLIAGQIDAEELAFLVRAQAALAAMHALTQAGITAAEVQRFRDGLINIVVNAAIKNFVPI